MIPLDEPHLRRLVRDYVNYYCVRAALSDPHFPFESAEIDAQTRFQREALSRQPLRRPQVETLAERPALLRHILQTPNRGVLRVPGHRGYRPRKVVRGVLVNMMGEEIRVIGST